MRPFILFLKLLTFVIAGGYIVFSWLMNYFTGDLALGYTLSSWLSILIFSGLMYLGWRFRIIP